jgi:hypothetical protein
MSEAPNPPPPAPESSGPATPTEFHRGIAVELFQHVLNLLERTDRTCAENDRMIHAAHASRFHYEFAGTPLNMALGEWQCARVHTAMHHRDAALHHAFGYLEAAETYGLGSFYLAHAHTAIAGALHLSKPEEAPKHLQTARGLLEEIVEEEEKKLLLHEIASIEKEIEGQAA